MTVYLSRKNCYGIEIREMNSFLVSVWFNTTSLPELRALLVADLTITPKLN